MSKKQITFSKLKSILKESLTERMPASAIDQDKKKDWKKLVELVGLDQVLDILASAKDNVTDFIADYEDNALASTIGDDVNYVLEPKLKELGFDRDDFAGCYDEYFTCKLDRISVENGFGGMWSAKTDGMLDYERLKHLGYKIKDQVDRALDGFDVVYAITVKDSNLVPEGDFNPPPFDTVLHLVNEVFQVVSSGKEGDLNYVIFVTEK